MEQELVHAATVAEPDLSLGRMHVDVDQIRRQCDEQAIRRIQLVMQDVAVGLLQGVDDQLVAHVAAIDEYMLAVAAARGGAGPDHPAEHPQHAGSGLDCDAVLLERLAQYLAYSRIGRLGIEPQWPDPT